MQKIQYNLLIFSKTCSRLILEEIKGRNEIKIENKKCNQTLQTNHAS